MSGNEPPTSDMLAELKHHFDVVGESLESKIELVAGLVLISIGLKILLEHLL